MQIRLHRFPALCLVPSNLHVVCREALREWNETEERWQFSDDYKDTVFGIDAFASPQPLPEVYDGDTYMNCFGTDAPFTFNPDPAAVNGYQIKVNAFMLGDEDMFLYMHGNCVNFGWDHNYYYRVGLIERSPGEFVAKLGFFDGASFYWRKTLTDLGWDHSTGYVIANYTSSGSMLLSFYNISGACVLSDYSAPPALDFQTLYDFKFQGALFRTMAYGLPEIYSNEDEKLVHFDPGQHLIYYDVTKEVSGVEISETSKQYLLANGEPVWFQKDS